MFIYVCVKLGLIIIVYFYRVMRIMEIKNLQYYIKVNF